MGVGRHRRHTRDREVEGFDRPPELAAEGEDEASKAAVDVQPDAMREGDLSQGADRIDGAVAVVAGGADDGHGLIVDGIGDLGWVDQRGGRVNRDPTKLDAEEVARLVEGRVRGLGLNDVRPLDATGCSTVFAIRQHGVADRAAAPCGEQAAGIAIGDLVGTEHAQGHGDDLCLHLGGAWAHVSLQDIDVREETEGLRHELIVVMVAAVHGA